MVNFSHLEQLCLLIRYDILTSTTTAGSGHPTTSLSAVELMTTLFFAGFYHFNLKNPKNLANDRVIFSKGHAAPLLYALYHAAGVLSADELLTLRVFDSVLEGHPTFRFKYADIATGSLGQGLSAGVGMALGIRLNIKYQILNIKRIPKVFVLLGDSEMAEGQVWEAMEIASYYKLNNLIAIVDVNRLGQRGETMLGWDLQTYAKRAEAFGWRTIIVDDGHDINQVFKAFEKAIDSTDLTDSTDKPTMILARTIKGKGVSFLENKEGWHGKPLNKEQLTEALKELGKVDINIRGEIQLPKYQISIPIKSGQKDRSKIKNIVNYKLNDLVATRLAYGNALISLGNSNEKIIVFDAEVSNSTFSEKFAKKFPERYFEMFIAEQNMISTAFGLSKLGFIPFVSTFAAFLTRGFDQIRMAQYSAPNLKIVGSHCGVSIGPDGPSQMGLEDLAMFRSILNSTIFYPADAVSTFKLTEVMSSKNGLFYLRTNRKETPVIYGEKEEFKIGGSKIHYVGNKNLCSVLIIAAGVTLHEALKAQKELAKKGIETVVLDCYSVKPLDVQSINRLVMQIKNVIVVEDHYPAGGIGEAVMQALLANPKSQNPNSKQIQNSQNSLEHSDLDSSSLFVACNLDIGAFKFVHLCVRKLPRSGTPEELLHYEEIDAEAIIKAVNNF